MTRTGWAAEEPDAEGQAPVMPLTNMLLDRAERRAGPLETALARSRSADVRELQAEAAAAPDPDERAAGLIARGVTPGMISHLSLQLADVQAELEAEHEKIAKGERVRARVAGLLERGQIGGLDAARMMDGDFGDAHRAEQLEHRAGSLGRQIQEAAELMSPPQSRQPDPLEATGRRARQILTEVTRAQIAEARARRPEPRPFASVSRAAGDTEHTGPDCQICAESRRMDAARSRDGLAPYAPGAVITSHWQEIAR